MPERRRPRREQPIHDDADPLAQVLRTGAIMVDVGNLVASVTRLEGMLPSYKGGQAEFANAVEQPGYIYRGQVSDIRILGSGLGSRLEIRLDWRAKYVNLKWVNDPEDLELQTPLAPYDITERSDGRTVLICHPVGTVITLFPKGGDAIERPPE
ncbi:MAG: hypothetical protein KGH72_04495 [Candidatus Micrarchaeota archaeon]|nr:hypothetical protein [Candidatus Micrarchaeota archaeon]